MFANKTVLAVALSALTFVAAQSGTTTTTPQIDVNSVPDNRKTQWCQAQTGTCLTLCNNVEPKTNDCNFSTLKFACTCNDNTTPDLAKYVATIPTFVCEEAFSQCITQNVGNATGQTACTNTIKKQCGTLEPTVSPVSSSSSATASATAATTSAAPTTSSSVAAAAPTNLANGAAIAALGLFAAIL